MKKQYYLITLLFFMPVISKALSYSQPKSYTIINNKKQYELYEIGNNMGQLNDGTMVKLVCIKKGMLGVPNISMPSYRGKYINNNGESCYVFVAEPEENKISLSGLGKHGTGFRQTP